MAEPADTEGMWERRSPFKERKKVRQKGERLRLEETVGHLRPLRGKCPNETHFPGSWSLGARAGGSCSGHRVRFGFSSCSSCL